VASKAVNEVFHLPCVWSWHWHSSFIAPHVHEGIAQLKCLIPGCLLLKFHAEKEVSCNDISVDVPSVDDELSVTLMSLLLDVKGQTGSCWGRFIPLNLFQHYQT
jgi:hypothetical protein